MMRTGLEKSTIGDVYGAFADGAILFPLLVMLVIKTGMDGALLLATAGVAYIVSGLMFRVPMSVQPLKSVVVTALALGATAYEVGLSGLLVGLLCLVLSFFNVNELAARVPRHLVHGLQAGLGILLVMKGVETGLAGGVYQQAFFLTLAALAIYAARLGKSIIGWMALAGVLGGIVSVYINSGGVTVVAVVTAPARWDIVLALVLPQMALTLANSVIGTHDVAHRYFGDRAARVTPVNLLRSIGIGNIIMAPLGGLPFCHGAGGVTAHVRGGATSWRMNLITGGVLLFLALISGFLPYPLIPSYPEALLGALLTVTGGFHLLLAAPSWKQYHLRLILVLMAGVALATQNMLWVLAVGIAGEVVMRLYHFNKGMKKR